MIGLYRMRKLSQRSLVPGMTSLMACVWLAGCSEPNNNASASVESEFASGLLERQYDLDIKKQSGLLAILEFASQTGLNVSVFEDLEDAPVLGPLKGRLTADRALSALLAQSGLTYEWVNHHTLVVQSEGKLRQELRQETAAP